MACIHHWCDVLWTCMCPYRFKICSLLQDIGKLEVQIRAQSEVHQMLGEQILLLEQMTSQVPFSDRSKLLDNRRSVEQKMVAAHDRKGTLHRQFQDCQQRLGQLVKQREQIKAQILDLHKEKDKYSTYGLAFLDYLKHPI